MPISGADMHVGQRSQPPRKREASIIDTKTVTYSGPAPVTPLAPETVDRDHQIPSIGRPTMPAPYTATVLEAVNVGKRNLQTRALGKAVNLSQLFDSHNSNNENGSSLLGNSNSCFGACTGHMVQPQLISESKSFGARNHFASLQPSAIEDDESLKGSWKRKSSTSSSDGCISSKRSLTSAAVIDRTSRSQEGSMPTLESAFKPFDHTIKVVRELRILVEELMDEADTLRKIVAQQTLLIDAIKDMLVQHELGSCENAADELGRSPSSTFGTRSGQVRF